MTLTEVCLFRVSKIMYLKHKHSIYYCCESDIKVKKIISSLYEIGKELPYYIRVSHPEIQISFMVSSFENFMDEAYKLYLIHDGDHYLKAFFNRCIEHGIYFK